MASDNDTCEEWGRVTHGKGEPEFMWVVDAGRGRHAPATALDAANRVHNIIVGWKNLDIGRITIERVQTETLRRVVRRPE